MLRMAKNKTHGCDAHSTRCTQLLIENTLAAEHNRVIAWFSRRYLEILRRVSKDSSGETRDSVQKNGTRRGRKQY